jgi:hypothetical protein
MPGLRLIEGAAFDPALPQACSLNDPLGHKLPDRSVARVETACHGVSWAGGAT